MSTGSPKILIGRTAMTGTLRRRERLAPVPRDYARGGSTSTRRRPGERGTAAKASHRTR